MFWTQFVDFIDLDPDPDKSIRIHIPNLFGSIFHYWAKWAVYSYEYDWVRLTIIDMFDVIFVNHNSQRSVTISGHYQTDNNIARS